MIRCTEEKQLIDILNKIDIWFMWTEQAIKNELI